MTLIPVSYRISKEHKDKVKKKAAKEEVSQSDIIRKLIREMK